MHYHSWSNMRKVLETDRLCPALRGRVTYFMTCYHDAHDDEGRFCIRVDGREYLNSHQWNHYDSAGNYRTPAQHDRDGSFCQCQALKAIYIYLDELTIDEALASDSALIRLLAVLDRRVGKRRMPQLAEDMRGEPEWLQFFYRLRLEAEGIPVKEAACG